MDWSDLGIVVLLVLIPILLVVLGVAIYFFVRLIKLRAVLADPSMPGGSRVAFWVAIAYTIFPFDVLPDPVYIDDVGVLAAAVVYIRNLAKKRGLLNGRGTPGHPHQGQPYQSRHPYQGEHPYRGQPYQGQATYQGRPPSPGAGQSQPPAADGRRPSHPDDERGLPPPQDG